MNEKQKEAFEAVQQINEELYVKYEHNMNQLPVIAITFADIFMSISILIPNFPEINLYPCEDDDRIFSEKTGDYEPFYYFIKRKFCIIQEEINKVKL